MVLLPAVNVDGFFVKENQRARKIHFADYIGRTCDIDDNEIVAGDRAQADRIGGIGFVRPVIMISGQMQKTRFGKPRAKVREVDPAESFAWGDGQFERGAFQMIERISRLSG